MNVTYLFVLIVVMVALGCDRIDYEMKSNKVSKYVADKYREINTVPDADWQYEACKAKAGNDSKIDECMQANGWTINPAWANERIDCLSRSQLLKHAENEIKVNCELPNGMHKYVQASSLKRMGSPEGQWEYCYGFYKDEKMASQCMTANGWKSNPRWQEAYASCFEQQSKILSISKEEVINNCNKYPALVGVSLWTSSR